MRVFFALGFDPPVVEALLDAREHFPVDADTVRWTAAARLHLTLQFLPAIEESSRSAVTEAGRDATRSVECFDLLLRGLGRFPDGGARSAAAQVLWVGAEPGPSLEGLAGALGRALDRRRVERDRKRFRPHVTLGRPRGRSRRIALRGPLDGARRVAVQEVREVLLVESRRGDRGHEYEVLERFPLATP